VKDAQVRAIRERNGRLFVIDDVPAQVCQECGEEFYRGWVLEEMDRLMDSGEGIEREITVPVMRFRQKVAA
jgi:YgiT-type zinc finger domain-containing protein